MSEKEDNQISLDEITKDDIPDKIPTKFINSRVIVFNPLYASYLYVKKKFFGAPLGINKPRLEYFSKPSELSLIEAYYLLEHDEITILDVKNNANLSTQEFFEICKQLHDKFEEKYIIYKDLRQKGYVPRPGLKFGADFAVYKQGPGLDHSPYVITALPKGSELTAMELVRAGRLATSVRKKFVIATILTNNIVRYYGFEWKKP